MITINIYIYNKINTPMNYVIVCSIHGTAQNSCLNIVVTDTESVSAHIISKYSTIRGIDLL